MPRTSCRESKKNDAQRNRQAGRDRRGGLAAGERQSALVRRWHRSARNWGEAASLRRGVRGAEKDLTGRCLRRAARRLVIDPLQECDQSRLLVKRHLFYVLSKESPRAHPLRVGSAKPEIDHAGKIARPGRERRGPVAAEPRSWSVRAASGLPVPLSPSIVAMRRWCAVQRICETSLCITALRRSGDREATPYARPVHAAR